MKIVCLFGSPRAKGNTAEIAHELLRRLEETGATAKSYHLNKMKYRGCQACMACKTTKEECVLQDDLKAVFADIKEADLVVIASPIYFGDLTGQTKLMVDRMYSYLPPGFSENPNFVKRLSPKKLVMILAQGAPKAEWFNDVFPRYTSLLKHVGFEDAHVIRAIGAHAPGEAMQHPEVVQQIDQVLVACQA